MENGSRASKVENNSAKVHSHGKLSAYLLALRPWSFSVSLMPVLLGFALAKQAGYNTSYISFIITALTALSVHGAGNTVNTYYDYLKGIDSGKSDDRTLVDHLLLTEEITFLGVVLYCIGCIGFVLLTLMTEVKLEHLAIIYFGGLSGSFLYTGGIGFKYIALGDILVLIIFGPVTVLFSYMVQTGTVNFGTIFYAIPLAFSAEAILHSNNTRDMESDKKAGIVTFAILIGVTTSEILYSIFLLSPFSMFAILGMKYSHWLLLPLLAIPEAFNIERYFRTVSKQHVPQKTAKLNLYMGFLYTLGVCLSQPKILPFIN